MKSLLFKYCARDVLILCVLLIGFLLSHEGESQTFSKQECIEILDSLYYVENPGDISAVIESSRFHIAEEESDSITAHIASYLAYVLEHTFQYDSALRYYRIAYHKHKALGDSLEAAHSLYGEASMLSDLQEYVLSTNKYLEVLEWYTKFGTPEDVADTYNALGNNYFYAGDEQIALQHYDRALTYYEKTEDKQQQATIMVNIAGAMSQLENYDAAFIYYQKALGLLLGTSHYDILINAYHGIGASKEEVGDITDAYYYYQRAFDLAKITGKEDHLGYSYQNLAYYFLSQAQLDSALYYGLKAEAIAQATGQFIMRYNTYDLMHQVYNQTGDHKKAYDYLSKLKAEDDSTFSINKARQINIMLQEYQNEKMQNQLLANDLERAAILQNNQRAQTYRAILIIALITFFIITILALRNERMKSKSNQLLRLKNDEILSKNKQIQKIEEAKSKWFINVSHELRTPLSLVKGPLQQIARVEKFSKQSQSLLNIANRNIAHLEQLIREILDLSKLEAGNVILKPEIFDLVEKTRHWLVPFQEVTKKHQLQILLDVKGAEHLFVKLDERQFNKVFNNLISNSIKYSHEGGRIKVSLNFRADKLFLTVRDEGVGIPKKELPFVFDRFFQASNVTQTEDTGTGVGLSMSKEIVELHKGKISIESTEGSGTAVFVEIPETVVDAPDNHNETREEKNGSYLTLRVLLIEDNPDMQEFVHSFLDKRFEVTRCMNALEAWESMHSTVPHLIISDLMMPRMDGFQFIRKVKENADFASIPIIVISAISDEESRLKLLRLGVNDYMVKPFNPEELVIKVENLLQNPPQKSKSKDVDAEDEDLSFEDRLIKDLEQKVREHLSDPDFNVTKLADEASLSERQLYRYLRQTVKMTPANFIKEIRLLRAFELARRNVYATTAELSYAVGFQHPSYFTNVFKKRFGKKPSDFMKEKST